MYKLKYFGPEYPLPISEDLKTRIKQSESDSIYKLYVHVIHEENDMYYVGVTKKTLAQRWGRGRCYPYGRMKEAIKKHGWNNIDHVVLSIKLDEETAHEFEIELIKELDSTNPERGFNISTGGLCGSNGVRKCGPENHFYGRKHSDKSRALIKAHHAPCSGKNNSFFGRKHSAESRARMSATLKGLQAGENSPVAKKVVNIETGMVFNTIKEACIYAGSGHVGSVCNGKRPSAGKKDGVALHWRFL